MTIYDVLKNDVKQLKELKLSAGDVDVWQTVMQVVTDLNACISAIERNTQAQAAAAEEPASADEPVPAADE